VHSFIGVAGLSTHTGVTWGHSFAGVAGLSTHGGGGGVVQFGGVPVIPGGHTVGGVQIG